MKKVNVKMKRDKRPDSFGWLCSADAYDSLCAQGYTRLSSNPEIMTAVGKIADLISSMTIHLMSNTGKGDERIVNELSKHIDIFPNQYMTRKTWMNVIVRTLLLEGEGNAIVYPKTQDGLLGDLVPISPMQVSFMQSGHGYKIGIGGVYHDPQDLLHFVINPDPDYPWKGQGYRALLKDIANNLKQATATEKGFMQSKWKPSVIVKIDGLTEEFADESGRKKILEKYIESDNAGEPWLIPADQFQIEQIKPLSLQDLAITDTVQLNKRTIASILGVPPWVVGVGNYNKSEWNNFVNTTILPIAKGIEQELTRKLLIAPNYYFKFNSRALYAYDLKELSEVSGRLFVRGLMTGNEARGWMNLNPLEGLDELVILENYIPRDMIGEQNKLNGSESGGDEDG